MRFAYADPPYLGLGRIYAKLDERAMDCNDPEWHEQLIGRMDTEFDAWALSLHSPSLRTILPMCPDDVRVMAWVKPWCSFKRGVNPAYAWEPIIMRGARKKCRSQPTVRDYHVANATMRRNFRGAKPESVAHWLFSVLGAEPSDEFHDLFPGSGAVTSAWASWCRLNQLWGSKTLPSTP